MPPIDPPGLNALENDVLLPSRLWRLPMPCVKPDSENVSSPESLSSDWALDPPAEAKDDAPLFKDRLAGEGESSPHPT